MKQVQVISFSAIDQTPDGAESAGRYNESMSVQGIISGQGIREKVIWKFLSEDFVVILISYGTERRIQHVQQCLSQTERVPRCRTRINLRVDYFGNSRSLER